MSKFAVLVCSKCGKHERGSEVFSGSAFVCFSCYTASQKNRVGDWIQTASGRQFWPLDPRPEEIFIEDIAHALSNQCRYGGHCRDHFSVAQHSVIVSRSVPSKDALWGLLHDASEAYLVDLPRPIKNYSALGDEYKKIEEKIMLAVRERFQLPGEEPASVIEVDKYRIILAEKRDLMAPSPVPWRESGHEPLPERIDPMLPFDAHVSFLERFYELTAADPTFIGNRRMAHTRALRAVVSTRFGPHPRHGASGHNCHDNTCEMPGVHACHREGCIGHL